jgi:long-chain acyl-CoA synthetase
MRRSSKLYSDQIAYEEIKPHKQIIKYSFNQLEKDVNALGTRLLHMNMKGYHFAVLSENSYAWVVSYLSIINGLGIVIPLDKELTDEDIVKLLIKSDADVIICSNTFASSMEYILAQCPNIKNCILINPDHDYDSPKFLSLGNLIEEGRELLNKDYREYLDLPIDTDSMCEIVFTSGTTGANKGVMLSHKNIMAVVYGSLSLIQAKGVSFSVLPINHTYECSCHILGGLYSGLTICFNDSLKRIMDNMKLVKPTMSVMVPLFLESMYKSIWKEAKKTGLEEHLKYGLKFSNLIRILRIDLRRILFKPVLDTFGGNLRQIVCGGAPLRSDIIKFFDSIGIEILNGYGITECGPLVATNSYMWKKPGSVGRVMPGCKVRISNSNENGYGEIQVKGDNVMLGYYNDPENTKLSFTEDGWLKTGDLGFLDNSNLLSICGREKNLIILPNGKNVHPEEIEEIITERLSYVKEVVVYSSLPAEGSEECITACVYIDEDFIASTDIDIKDKLNQDIRLLNKNLPVYKRITNILVSESVFEKTTTKKIKRSLVLERGDKNV